MRGVYVKVLVFIYMLLFIYLYISDIAYLVHVFRDSPKHHDYTISVRLNFFLFYLVFFFFFFYLVKNANPTLLSLSLFPFYILSIYLNFKVLYFYLIPFRLLYYIYS